MAPASGVVLDGVDMATYRVDERIGRPCDEEEEGCRNRKGGGQCCIAIGGWRASIANALLKRGE
jgi:hypothetical protein